MSDLMLRSALRYRRRGFSVIPCKPDKRPIVKWESYQREKPSEDQIKEWWQKYPYANIGIITGEISGIDVLDCDTEESFRNLNENFLPDSFQTPIVKSPRGYHVYFKHKQGVVNKARVVDGTDIRTTGGYILAPPSKNGNQGQYSWFEGLSPKDVDFAPMPDFLFETLKAGCLNYNNNIASITREGGVIGGGERELEKTRPVFFTEGRRDDDLFHIANCLVKGGCERDIAEQVLKIIADKCSPPFPENEVLIKIKSALDRETSRTGNLSQEIREWVLSNPVQFSSNNVQNCLNLSSRKEKKLLSTVLSKMVEEGIIERDKRIAGLFRGKPEAAEPVDFSEIDENKSPIWLPFGLHNMVEIMDGNIIGVYGEVESGKTAILLNIARYNLESMRVHYFNSEMGKKEFSKRLKKFNDITFSDWKAFLNFYEVEGDFHDHIRSGVGNLNIIDFLEIHKDFWEIGAFIKKIHDALKGAIAVVAIQKNPGRDEPLGGHRAMEKPRLVISVGRGTAKITKAKNWAEGVTENPRGKSNKFKLVDGWNLIQTQDWRRENV